MAQYGPLLPRWRAHVGPGCQSGPTWASLPGYTIGRSFRTHCTVPSQSNPKHNYPSKMSGRALLSYPAALPAYRPLSPHRRHGTVGEPTRNSHNAHLLVSTQTHSHTRSLLRKSLTRDTPRPVVCWATPLCARQSHTCIISAWHSHTHSHP